MSKHFRSDAQRIEHDDAKRLQDRRASGIRLMEASEDLSGLLRYEPTRFDRIDRRGRKLRLAIRKFLGLKISRNIKERNKIVKPVGFDERSCEEVRSRLDFYLSDELPGEINEGMRKHLDDCRSCAEMFEEQERVRRLLRLAVRSEIASPALRAKIQEQTRARRQPFNFFSTPKRWMAIAACLLVALSLAAWRIGLSSSHAETASALVTSDLNPTLSDETKRILGSGSSQNGSSIAIVTMKKQAQTAVVHHQRLRKG